MKINLLSKAFIFSSVMSIIVGVGLTVSGSQKLAELQKKPVITITRAHPLSAKLSTDNASLELRSGPADYFPIVGRLAKKEDYQIIDSDGDWYRIAPIRNPASAAWARLNPSMR
ncbi:MAG: hypothetical protein KA715_12830 [Xanthomonadaceae bacterium]|nr:hypothetical protein [Xanthomonadaceae bacterium]